MPPQSPTEGCIQPVLRGETVLLMQQEASGNLKSEEEGSPGESGERGRNEPVDGQAGTGACAGLLGNPQTARSDMGQHPR